MEQAPKPESIRLARLETLDLGRNITKLVRDFERRWPDLRVESMKIVDLDMSDDIVVRGVYPKVTVR